MSQEIILRGAEGEHLIDPFTEGLVIRTPAEAAEWLEQWKEDRRVGDAFARRLKDCALDVMDARAQWTLPAGRGWKLVGASPQSGDLQWDLDELEKLKEADPPLPEDRFNELVYPAIEYKVRANEAKRIEAANPVWAEIIRKARSRKKASRNVDVKRAGA